jgi:hypothetical protein
MAELTEEDRALLEACISKVLGRNVHRVSMSELIETLPDPGELVRMI